MQYKILFLLFAGHLITDVTQGMVPALLPHFIAEYGLNYSAAGFLILALTISSSIVQPVFGYLADKKSLPWFVALGPLLAGIGIAIAGLFHQYYIIVAGIFICGLGVAAFHPEGARIAGKVAGEKKASGMSFFSVGGNAGFALGPMVTTGLILLLGLKGISLYLVPAVIMSLILFQAVGRLSRFSPQGNQNGEELRADQNKPDEDDGLHDAWGAFVLLTLAIICRSIIHQGMNTFLPSYWIEVFHASKEGASLALTIMLGMGVLGNLAGGRLGDRFGYQRTVLVAFLLLIPQLFIFSNLTNASAATILLMTIGFTVFVSFSPMIVMGQLFLPKRAGFASGITIGLAVSVGGFVAPLWGKLADFAGVAAVFHFLPVFPVLAVILMYFVPKLLGQQAVQ
ncbi:MFS transporter [Dehalobacterium formicoaceticum]|uniref:MFS transporter n=1 Tax=Dehalobacterium formicoaceticum TaxID=51515 RepID=UPI000B7FA2C5|nr:MFS transporter [Dehalobacterium formicoaceticum]